VKIGWKYELNYIIPLFVLNTKYQGELTW